MRRQHLNPVLGGLKPTIAGSVYDYTRTPIVPRHMEWTRPGLRRVENLFTNTYLSSTSGWSGTHSSSLIVGNPGSLPPGASYALKNTCASGQIYSYAVQSRAANISALIPRLYLGALVIFSSWVYIPSGTTGSPQLSILRNAAWSGAVNITISTRDTWVRAMVSAVLPSSDNSTYYFLIGLANTSAGNISYMSQPMLEVVSGRGPGGRVCSEYVSKGELASPFHGANVDGVKYFDTYNPNTVDSGGLVTDTGNVIYLPRRLK